MFENKPESWKEIWEQSAWGWLPEVSCRHQNSGESGPAGHDRDLTVTQWPGDCDSDSTSPGHDQEYLRTLTVTNDAAGICHLCHSPVSWHIGKQNDDHYRCWGRCDTVTQRQIRGHYDCTRIFDLSKWEKDHSLSERNTLMSDSQRASWSEISQRIERIKRIEAQLSKSKFTNTKHPGWWAGCNRELRRLRLPPERGATLCRSEMLRLCKM